MLTDVILLIIFIVLSAFFSGVETALFTLSKLRVKYLVKKKVKNSELVEKIKSNPQRLLITILVGNNLVNVAASALATSIAIQSSLNYAIGIATGFMTLLLLIFGEITPKSIATRNNEKISLKIAKFMIILMTILFPVVFLFEKLTNILMGKKKNSEKLITEEEIKTYVTLGEEIGEVKESERQMIHRIFKFSDMESKEIMIPRNKIIAINSEFKVKEVAEKFSKEGYSRLPVYESNFDNIIGFVHLQDVQKALLDDKKTQKVKDIIRPVLFIPESKKLDSLLHFFQRKKQHLAIVVNEFGTNVGLVTLEDVLEEIVGEIVDETEKIEPMIKKIDSRTFIVEGRVDIDEINEVCNTRFPEQDLSYSLSNFILHKAGVIPEKDEVFDFPHCELKIESINNNAINKVIIKVKK